MIDIGVICSGDAADILANLYAVSEEPVCVKSIVPGMEPERFNVLLMNDPAPISADFLAELTDEDVVVINADNKELCACLKGSRGRLITYGFSSKACVTASSVMDEAYESVLLCVQRAIPTLAGGIVEPQEFPVSFDTPKNICCVLGAATAALVAGLGVENF